MQICAKERKGRKNEVVYAIRTYTYVYMYNTNPILTDLDVQNDPSQAKTTQGKQKVWSHTGSNCGPLACEASVITNYTMRPGRIHRRQKRVCMKPLLNGIWLKWQLV